MAWRRVWGLSWRVRTMSSATSVGCCASEARCDAERVIAAAIGAVSPPELVSRALTFDANLSTFSVAGHRYQVNSNVKVVGFGKAVLGMASAVEHILGHHVTEGVVSVPVGAVEMAREHYPHHLLQPNTKIKVYEGAAGNLPDAASELAAREVLSVARGCGRDDLLLVLVSGGGSALLSCPAHGITILEKREVVESLARAGADIQEMNTFRKAVSQTKGGRLAEAALPAKVLGLILSDVIGDPLDIIASGPTVLPGDTDPTAALHILDKYGLRDAHSSITRYLESATPPPPCSRGDDRVLNVIVGSNESAVAAAKEAAIGHGYASYTWSRQLQGEASSLGEVYAVLAHYLLLKRHSADSEERRAAREMLYTRLGKLSQEHPELEQDVLDLTRSLEMLLASSGGGGGDDGGPLCLIGAGEPTVTVRGEGRGGRNQELALAYLTKLGQLREGQQEEGKERGQCVFASVGTDGQDAACDAAGAMVDFTSFASALEQGLEPSRSLLNNDSHTFFLALSSGRNLVRTGLTSTNVMDIHVLLVR